MDLGKIELGVRNDEYRDIVKNSRTQVQIGNYPNVDLYRPGGNSIRRICRR